MAAPAPTTVPLNVSAVVTLSPAISMGVVQHASSATQFTAGTGGTAIATFANSPAKGNSLIACFTFVTKIGVGAVVSVTTGAQPENWTKAVTDGSASFIYVNPNTGGGQKNVNVTVTFGGTVTTSTSAAIVMDIYEVSGLPSSAIVDQIASTQFSDATIWSTTTPVTTSPNEIWFGITWCTEFTANTPATITGPGAPWNLEPQVSSSAQNGGIGSAFQFDFAQVSGYQIVSAEAAVTWAGTATESGGGNNGYASVAALFGSARSGGAGTALIGPIHHREVWYPEVISVSVSSNNAESTCRIYAGPDATQSNFVDSTTTGSTGFSTFPTTNRQVKCGENVFAAWNAGDGGAQGRLVIVGQKVIGSGGPPGWTHVRTRKLG